MKSSIKPYFIVMMLLLLSRSAAYGQEQPRAQILSAIKSDTASDLFAQFGLQKQQIVPGLEKNSAPLLPDKELPWDNLRHKGFKPMVKITTQKQLDAELIKMRKRYAPFMAQLAPALPIIRQKIILDTFRYRLVSSEMEPVKDTNNWQTVSIPNYGGPINKAEACYQKELNITKNQLSADQLFLHFNAVDYVAQVFVNGKQIGAHTGIFGAFEFNIKPWLHFGKNLLQVKVFNDAIMMGDFFNTGPGRKFGKKIAACGGPGWNTPGFGKGWQMCPPGFGIWQSCYLETRSNIYVNSLFVKPYIKERRAEVWIELPETAKDVELRYSLFGQNFKTTIVKDRICKNATVTAAPAAAGFKLYKFSITIPSDKFRLWDLTSPWLYQVQVSIMQRGKIIDAAKRQFGMRSFLQSATSVPKGRFYLNGKEIKLRGANMMGNIMQCIIRKDFHQLRDDILLAKIAHMTFWRMTQQPCQPEAYDYFDQLGLLAQTDFPTFNGIRKDVVETAKSQFVEMVKLVRSHPSNAIISYLNEPDFTKPMMMDRKGHERLFTRFDSVAEILNPGQVTKWVEGDYVNLSHKYSDHHVYDTWYGNGIKSEYFGNWGATRAGWMHACGEFGSEGLDNIKLMQKYYPDKWLETTPDGKWSPDQIPGCQTLKVGAKWQVLTDRSISDWVYSSRNYQMWATRLFTETLRRDYKMNAFAIHLLIDAWPAGWLKAIVDYDRKAKPAYFAYRDALTPLAVNLRPDAFYGFAGQTRRVGVWVCNDYSVTYKNATLQYQVEFDGKIIKNGHAKITVAASNPDFEGWIAYKLPAVSTRKKLTIRVALISEGGKRLHESDVQLEVYPATDKAKKLIRPGGTAQRLIAQ